MGRCRKVKTLAGVRAKRRPRLTSAGLPTTPLRTFPELEDEGAQTLVDSQRLRKAISANAAADEIHPRGCARNWAGGPSRDKGPPHRTAPS